jgi:hypothetical protein
VYGFAHIWGPKDHFNIRVVYWLYGVNGTSQSNIIQFAANGNFEYLLTMDMPEFGEYVIAPHMYMQYATATADSYIQWQRIELLPLDTDYCK